MSTISSVSVGEYMSLNFVRQQAKAALWESLGASEEINNSSLSTEKDMSSASTFPDSKLSGYRLTPVDTNCDGEVSEDEFNKSYFEAQNILAEIDAYQVRMRAYQARMNADVDFLGTDLAVNE